MATTTKKTMKLVFFITIATAMFTALSTLISIGYQKHDDDGDHVKVISDSYNNNKDKNVLLLPSKRVNRFLAESSRHHPADHCHKDYEVCHLEYGTNSTCCGNKCFDLATDKAHCGACHSKCKFTDSCCGGKCVNLAYDKRNCGSCNNKCLPGQYCVYGMCDYA